MVTRPTNHMISTCNHSYDLLIWCRYVTYKLYLDIKLLSIQYLHHHSHVITTSRSLIFHVPTTITSSHHRGTCYPLFKDLAWALSRLIWRPIRKTTSRSTPVLDLVVVAWGEVPSIITIRRPLEGATTEVIREEGWPDAIWPDTSGRQHQLQPWSTILLNK